MDDPKDIPTGKVDDGKPEETELQPNQNSQGVKQTDNVEDRPDKREEQSEVINKDQPEGKDQHLERD